MQASTLARAITGAFVAMWTVACAVASPPSADADRVTAMEGLIAGFRARFEDVPEVEARALVSRLQQGSAPVLVDVRTPAERAISTLPGAVTPEQIEADPERYKGKELIAYCTIGYRSSAWAQTWRKRGLDVKNLHGSLLAWTHAGGPLVHDEEPTRRVHVYGATWNFARSDYEAVW